MEATKEVRPTGDDAFDRMRTAQRETAQVARDAIAQMRKSNALAAQVSAELTAIRAENAKLVEALQRGHDLCELGHGHEWALEVSALLQELGESA